MPDLLITHGTLLTLRGGHLSPIADGAIALRDGRIAWIGATADLPATYRRDAEAIDAQQAVVTPGLIDCHTHLVYAGNRARELEMRLQGRTYADIAREGGGIASTVKATRAAGNAALRAATARRLEPFMAEGVTTIEIKSGYGLDVENELRCLRTARSLAADHAVSIVTTLLGAHAVPPEFAGRPDAYVDLVCAQMIPQAASDRLATAVDAFCETIAFSPAQVRRVFEAARRHGLRVKLHADQLSDGGGAGLAAQFGALSADHIEHANDEGLAAMARSECVAVLLPAAFFYLRETRLPPVAALRRLGVRMAVSTDCNPGTSPCTSITTAMNMACVSFGLTVEESIAGATCHAAAALGLDDRGVLEAGKRADIAVWDAHEPAELVAHIGGMRPRKVIFEGRVRG